MKQNRKQSGDNEVLALRLRERCAKMGVVRWHAGVLASRCAGVRVRWRAGALACRHAGAEVRERGSAQVRRRESARAR